MSLASFKSFSNDLFAIPFRTRLFLRCFFSCITGSLSGVRLSSFFALSCFPAIILDDIACHCSRSSKKSEFCTGPSGKAHMNLSHLLAVIVIMILLTSTSSDSDLTIPASASLSLRSSSMTRMSAVSNRISSFKGSFHRVFISASTIFIISIVFTAMWCDAPCVLISSRR